MSDREDSQNLSVHSYGSGGRSPTFGSSSSSSSSDSEHPATSPQKKPVDASTCAPSFPVASVAQPEDEGFILLDDRLVQTQSSIMQKAQVHEVRNLMPDGYQLTYRATWKSIIPLHVGSFINVCWSLRIPLSLRLFDHMFDVRPGSKETLGFVVVSSHQGRAFLCSLPPSNKKWKDKYVCIKFPPVAFPFAQNVWGKRMKRQVKPAEADDLVAWEATLQAGTPPPAVFITSGSGVSTSAGRLILSRRLSCPGPSPKLSPSAGRGDPKPWAQPPPVLHARRRRRRRKIVVEEPSTAQPLNASSSQPFLLDEQPAQSHQGTNQPIHSGELYINVDTFEFDTLMGETGHTSQAGQAGQPNVDGEGEEEAGGESLQRKRRKTEEVGRIGEEYFARLVKSKEEEKARLEAMMEVQKLGAENARSAEEIARLGDELAKERAERAALAAAWAVQEPEEFAAQALPDRETAIRFFQGLYKHKVSVRIVDEIGTFGFESGQYTERRALYGILEQRIQSFRPKALSLPELHDEEPVPPFPGI
ncbi:unnamed protein product [Cuscuta campestris]|uniref:Uncharacterized protein n=1 Tax=Cuscuta campestris TaxID=132261 RepID=A0A484MHR7_9ASTE|nr:unnamed protein product [Cuscuta campestris]